MDELCTEEGFTKCHVLTRVSVRSILPDLEKINVPDEVKQKAEDIYIALGRPTRRAEKRKGMLFFCLANAYSTLGKAYLPNRLAAEVGVHPSKTAKYNSMFKEIETGYRPPIVIARPQDFFEILGEIFNLKPEAIRELHKLTAEIFELDPSLRRLPPQNVATGILYYYLVNKGITYSYEDFSRLSHISEPIISSTFTRVFSVHNA